MVDGHNLEVVDHAKLLGVTITSNLSWNMHLSEIVKKASKRLYFRRQLRRAQVEKADLLRFYTSCIRSVCDYAIPVFHASLPQYLIDDLERVQKRALSIICPHLILRQRPSLVRPGVISGSPSVPMSVPFR